MIWLGSRLFSDKWIWLHSDYDMSDGYKNWGPDQPTGDWDCVYMDPTTGQWFDVGCGLKRLVVCEYEN